MAVHEVCIPGLFTEIVTHQRGVSLLNIDPVIDFQIKNNVYRMTPKNIPV